MCASTAMHVYYASRRISELYPRSPLVLFTNLEQVEKVSDNQILQNACCVHFELPSDAIKINKFCFLTLFLFHG